MSEPTPSTNVPVENTATPQGEQKETQVACPVTRFRSFLYYFFGGSAALAIMFFAHRRLQKN